MKPVDKQKLIKAGLREEFSETVHLMLRAHIENLGFIGRNSLGTEADDIVLDELVGFAVTELLDAGHSRGEAKAVFAELIDNAEEGESDDQEEAEIRLSLVGGLPVPPLDSRDGEPVD